MTDLPFPAYEDLPVIEATGDRHAWGVFGAEDQLGTINRLTPERMARAAGLVHKGKAFNLSLPLDQPNPPVVDSRKSYRHDVFSTNRNSRDDKLDDFYLQASSQLDALRHMRFRELGFYNGLQEEDTDRGALGINLWADHGIVGRGVLLDVPRHMERRGTPLDPSKDTPLEEDLLAEALQAQGVETEEGDILLLRTGWMGYYLGLTAHERERLPHHLGPGGLGTPGLKATREMAGFLWDRGFALVAADNPAVEDTPGSPDVGFLHRRLIPLLGMALGELWDLEALAEDCAADGVYECMVVSVPLNLPRGVGSPANAIALK